MRLTSASPSYLWALALLLLSPAIQAAVLAIDYGAEFTKLSLVKPGVPFDVVLDRDSKRKISSVVGWKRDDRVFGAEGKMSATRFPDSHFPYIKPLLAQSVAPDSESLLYPSAPTVINNTLYFPHASAPSHITPASSSSSSSPSLSWSPTALLAHQVSYFRGLAESLASSSGSRETIKDVIVTVPSWWTQHQRRAYRDALELQGLTCLSMIGEGTAVGLNFAMTRSFPNYDPKTGEGEKEYHVIFDSGAMSTTATVLGFYQTSYLPTPKSKTPINTTHVEVLGTGWSTVGGVDLDVAVQKMLKEDFAAKTGKDVSGDKRALAKLAKEANRVKQILSANQESNVAIESLSDDVDYRSRLSRASLESAISPLSPSFSSPLTSALSSASLTLDQVSSVLLFGGNTRVPLVQSALREALGSREDIIAQNVNADEAAVLGAAFYGAGLSRQFRMKNVEVHEKTVYEFAIGTEGEPVKVLFEKGTELGERKAVELKAEDQSVEILQDGKPVFAIQLTDVASSLSNFSSPEPFINLTFRLDARGHIAAVNAAIVSNATVPEEGSGGVAGALKGLFGKKDKEEVTVEGDDGDDGKVEKDGKKSDNGGKDTKDKEKEKTAAVKKEKVAVKFREVYVGVRPMNGEEKRTTQARLLSIASYERRRHNREEARNLLEGYLYRLQGLLNPESENKAMEEYAKPEERDALNKAMKEAFEWLADHAESAEEAVLRKKRTDIEAMETPIIHRFKESRTRPESVDNFQQAMFAARQFYIDARSAESNLTSSHANATAEAELNGTEPPPPLAPPRYSKEELDEVKDYIIELEKWMNAIMEEQVPLELDKTSDPVVKSAELDERGKKLQKMVLDLQNRKPPKAPRVRPSSSSSSASTSSTASSSSSPSTTSTSSSASDEKSTASPPKHEEL